MNECFGKHKFLSSGFATEHEFADNGANRHTRIYPWFRGVFLYAIEEL